MEIELVDTHAHLYDNTFVADISQVITQSRQAGIVAILLPNVDRHTLEPMMTLANSQPGLCMPMIGIHPNHIQKDFQRELYFLESWLTQHTYIAIGEVGLDLYHDNQYQAWQEEAFSIQLVWAKEYQLPVVIHSRGAFEATTRLIEKYQDGSLKGVFHCFSGTLAEAEKIIALGFHVGIGGIITFKNSSLGAVVTKLDLQHIVLETDSPYLAPVPYRGTRNNPSYLPYIATAVAHNKQVSLATVASITTANARKTFNLPL